MKRLMVGFAAAALAALGAGSVTASAADANWKLGYYNTSGRALSMMTTGPGDGVAAFDFTDQPNTALLVTQQGSLKGTLLGDLTGATIDAKFTITGATDAFTYAGEGTPSNPCTGPLTAASVRLFFETDNGGGFGYTHYWWSNPQTVLLANGSFELNQVLNSDAGWSDWNGQLANSTADIAAGFDDAAANVTMIGLSFGGGCFFENGVGTADGSGTFTLDSYSVS